MLKFKTIYLQHILVNHPTLGVMCTNIYQYVIFLKFFSPFKVICVKLILVLHIGKNENLCFNKLC